MTDVYTLYYLQQAEGRYGGQFHASSQKGDGLGQFLGGLFRRIFPLLSSGAKALGREAFSTGVGLLKDAMNGRPIKESVRERVAQAGTNLTNKAATKMESMVGNGYKRKRGRKRSQSRKGAKRRKVVRSRKPKRKPRNKQKDIFG
jgi:hypothetical protein